jgi:probable HAF family extracellular repeat protein
MATTALIIVPKAEARQASLEDLFDDTYRAAAVVGLSSNGMRAAVNGFVGHRREAFYWDGTRLVSVGGLDRNVNAMAMAISGDGTTIVGQSIDPYVRARAFRWTARDGIIDLGTLRTGNGGNSIANDASHDGRIVVGQAAADDGLELGFAWVMGASTGQSDDGQMFALVALPGGVGSAAHGVSADGRFAVGISQQPSAGVPANRAVVWHLSGIESGHSVPITILRDLGGPTSEANAVSDNGSVIVGSAETATRYVRAVRWTGAAAGGWELEELGILDGGVDSYATVVSGDGRIVGGYSNDVDGRAFAFRWEEDGGMVYLGDFLLEHGVDVGTLRLEDLLSLSSNGAVMGGMMEDENGNKHAFIARVAYDPDPEPEPEPNPEPVPGSGLMNVDEYHRSLFATTQMANAGQYLAWLPMNGAHHRPLMRQGSLSEDSCVWATGDLAHHGDSNTGLGLAEIGGCVDLFGGNVRAGLGVGTSHAWQSLPAGGSSRLAGQYVVGEVDWQPDGTPLLLSLTGMLGGWQANIHRGYSNGAATAYSDGQTQLGSGVIRLRADWLEAASIGSTTINPWASVAVGRTDIGGYVESGGPFPARFDAQSLVSHEFRVGVTAVTEFSDTTSLSTTIEVAHRAGTAPAARGNVIGLFDFNLGGGNQAQTWARIGADLDHQISNNAMLSLSVNAATQGQDASIGGSIGFKATF